MKMDTVRMMTMTALMAAAMSTTAFAGSWRTDGGGRWYQNDDGSCTKNGWQWIDSDDDGYSECFYFDSNGYVLTNTRTPDGSQVNGIGAWVKDGHVQSQAGGSGSSGGNGGSSWDSSFWGDSSGTGGSSYDDWGWLFDYEYDPYWYENDPELSEGEKAGYHYSDVHQDYSLRTEERWNQVNAQYDRIAANPTPEAAQAEMVWVEIPVWRLKNGQKTAGTDKVQVLSSIADEVKAIFTEIYNGPEQFPIQSIGAYSWRGNGLGSCHSAGMAIDINPDQNPQVRMDGTVLVGNKWEPGVNPYSIGRDSDVVKAFGKYGWTWGAMFSTKDYMHFEW